MSKEAMKLALEALEFDSHYGTGKQEAITALREALAEQPRAEGTLAQQEPVATKLHEAKQNFERNFEPHAMADWIYSDLLEWLGDTSPPAQRTWVELTFAEICECENDYLHIFARAIEAKLKEKNT